MRSETASEARRRRRAFASAVASFRRVSRVADEIRRRLHEHLDPVRIDPEVVLDLGSGAGESTVALARRYSGASVIGLDFALPFLLAARPGRPAIFRRYSYVCADAGTLPFSDERFQLVCANLAPAAFLDPPRWIGEMARVLDGGGLACFSTFGPDTFTELRSCWAEVDASPHVHDFPDMHDVGDELMRAGLSDVVVDAERLTVEEPDFRSLVDAVKASGAANTASDRRRGLTTPARLERVARIYESLRRNGALPVTLEVVYAHAWKPERRPGSVLVEGPARSVD